VRLVRWSLAPGGWRVVVEGEGEDAGAAGEAVSAALHAAVSAEGGGEASAEALEALRIEAGEPAWGAELSSESFLPETGLEQSHVSYTKGCYPGQEPVARVHFKGRTNRTRGAVAAVDGGVELAPGQELFDAGGKAVGRVTSACWSPDLGRSLGLATIRREVEEPGSRAHLEGADGPEVEVVAPDRGGVQ
jgi:folate-binding protein YgfZ